MSDFIAALGFGALYAVAMVLEVVLVLRCRVWCPMCRRAAARAA